MASAITSPEITYDSSKTVGDSSSGKQVFKGKFGNREAAIKAMVINSEKDLRRIKSEIEALIACEQRKHNVLQYFSFKQMSIPPNSFRILLALELCNGSLKKWIDNKDFRNSLPTISKVEILQQITNGLAHVHENRLVHRALKPENILLTTDHGQVIVKISDFGLCKFLTEDVASVPVSSVTTVDKMWSAPEILHFIDNSQSQPLVPRQRRQDENEVEEPIPVKASRAADIFSLGCIFYYVISDGNHPFGKWPSQIEPNIRNNILCWGDPENNPEIEAPVGTIPLIRCMISPDRRARPSASNIKYHHIFWPAKEVIRFLVDVSNLSEKGSKICEDVDENFKVEICGHEENGWLSKIVRGPKDEDVLNFLANKNKIPQRRACKGKSVMELVRQIRNFANHWGSQDDPVKEAIGEIPEKFLTYWTTRFPSLVHRIWMRFQEMQDKLPDGYYPQHFEFPE